MTNVLSFWTGEPLGPVLLEALESRERELNHAADQELLRQLDAYVEAYQFTWEDLEVLP